MTDGKDVVDNTKTNPVEKPTDISVEQKKVEDKTKQELGLDHEGMNTELSKVEQEKESELDDSRIDKQLESIRLGEGSTLSYVKDSPLVFALGGPENPEAIRIFSSLDQMFTRLMNSYVVGKESLSQKDLMGVEQFNLLKNTFVVSLIQGIGAESEADQSGGVMGKLSGWLGGVFGQDKVEKPEDISLTKLAAGFLGKMNKLPAKHVSERLEKLVDGIDMVVQSGKEFSLTTNSADLLAWFNGTMPAQDLESKVLQPQSTGDIKDEALSQLASQLILDEDGQATLKKMADIDSVNKLLSNDQMQKQSRDMYGSFEKMLTPFKRLLGKDSAKDILDSWGLSGVANLFLGWIGYEGGLDALHNKYLLSEVEQHMDPKKKEAVVQAFKWTEANLNNQTTYPLDKGFETKLKQAGITDKHHLFPHLPLNAQFITDALKASLQTSKALPPLDMIKKYCPQCIKSEQKVDGKKHVDVDADLFFSDENLNAFVSQIGIKSFLAFVNDTPQTTKGVIASPQALMALWVSESFMAPGTMRAFGDGVLAIGDGEYFDTSLVSVASTTTATTAITEGLSLSTSGNESTDGVSREQVSFENSELETLYKEHPPLDSQGLSQAIDQELKKAPFKSTEVFVTSRKFSIPVEYLLAFMKNDSGYGTAGLAVGSKNPGNVGTYGNKVTKFDTWQEGIDAAGKNLANRIRDYRKAYPNRYPTAKELADNIGPDGKGFFASYNVGQPNPERKGAYMEANIGPKNVNNFVFAFIKKGITNRQEFFTQNSLATKSSVDDENKFFDEAVIVDESIEHGKRMKSAPGYNTIARSDGYITSGHFWPNDVLVRQKIANETKKKGDIYLQKLESEQDPVLASVKSLPEFHDDAFKYGFLGIYYSYKELGTRYLISFAEYKADNQVVPVLNKLLTSLGKPVLNYKTLAASSDYNKALSNLKEVCKMFYDAKTKQGGIHTHCMNGVHRANIHMYAAKMIVENKPLEQVAQEFKGLDRDWMKKEEVAHGKDGGGYGKFHELLVKISENRAQIAKDFGYLDAKEPLANKEKITKSSILGVGDSIMMGMKKYGSFEKAIDYVDGVMTGGKSSQWLWKTLFETGKIDRIIQEQGINAFVLFCGFNDGLAKESQINSFSKPYITKMAEYLLAKYPHMTLSLSKLFSVQHIPKYSNFHIKEFNSMIDALSKTLSIKYPGRIRVLDYGSMDQYTPTDLHPNGQGYAQMVQTVYKTLIV